MSGGYIVESVFLDSVFLYHILILVEWKILNKYVIPIL